MNSRQLPCKVPGLLGTVCLCIALSACGLTAPRGNDGYADLDSLGVRDVDQVMTLSIGPALLHFAASHVDDDSEAVVINLMGEIRPEQFGGVMLALDVDAPGIENVEHAVGEEG